MWNVYMWSVGCADDLVIRPVLGLAGACSQSPESYSGKNILGSRCASVVLHDAACLSKALLLEYILKGWKSVVSHHSLK